MLIEARDITKAYGSFKAVDGANLIVEPGTILGLIGPNGAGKSTLFNCLTGDVPPTSGTVFLDGRDVTRLPPEERARRGLARTFQVPQTFQQMTVLENVMVGAFLRTAHTSEAMACARAVIEDVGLGSFADAPARSLGTPGRKRLEIARALATRPKVLLLDEAMAGLMPADIQRAIALVRKIHASGITIVVVEHIIEVIISLAKRVVVLQQGREIAQGTPAEITSNPAVIEAYLGKRGAKTVPGVRPRDPRQGIAVMRLSVENLEVRYGDLIGVADVSLEIPAGTIVALLGSNGAGKTTTLNAIAGLIPAAKGSITFGAERIDRHPAHAIVRKGLALSPEGWRLFVQQSVEKNLLLGATPLPDRSRKTALLERVYAIFPRLAERRHQRAGTMSGGERQMLAIGRALMSDPKLVMLDEPSLGLAPAVIDILYETLVRLHREGLTILLAEQAIEMALEVADHAYVLQVGRSVLSGPARQIAQDPEVQQIYLGITAGTR